ncbi:unknown [Clostridium sp. CAG:921]|nr:unknown [Clostridium sp. CAG:921]
MRYASNGINEPLLYERLSIYTAMPGEDRKTYNAGVLIDTIMQNNNVILMDADFTTPVDYFRLCQEIYVVQDMDIININQLTIFLRQLKARGIPMNKIKVIINKHVNCALTAKDILDGIATYTSYDLKMYDELFNSNAMTYFILPFDEENYKKYVEMVYKYSNKFSSFTDDFKESLNKIINSIYPVGNIVQNATTKGRSRR